MIKITENFIFIFLFLLFAYTSAAEEINFSASVNQRELTTQDILTLSLTITGTQKVAPPKLPAIEGLNLLYGPSVSSQTQVINGVVSTKRIFEYGFSPAKEGDFLIPGFKITIEGKDFRSDPIEIKVSASASAPQKEGESGQDSANQGLDLKERIFIELTADKKEAVVGEQLVLSFCLYRNIPAENLSYDPPVTKGFLEEPLGEQRSYRKIINGIEYDVIEIKKALFPLYAGDLEVPAVKVQGNLLLQTQAKRSSRSSIDSFFDDPFSDSFFGRRYVRKPFVLNSDPVHVKVNPLPEEGKPEKFSGAVGDFSLQVNASPSELAVGDPITLTMKVKGKGNLQGIKSPVILGAMDSFKVYEPESKTNIESREDGIEGEKIFEVVLVPKKVVSEVPEVEFSYFDTRLGEYETVKKGPFSIKVNPSKQVLSPMPSLMPDKKSVELLTKDIFYIKTASDSFKPIGFRVYKQPMYLGALAGPGILFFGLLFWCRKREKLLSDPRQIRLQKAASHARQLLKEAASEKNYKEAYALVEKSLIDYIADKTGRPVGAVNINELSELLSSYSFSEEQISKVSQLLRTCEQIRFAGGKAETANASSEIDSAKAWISRAEKVFK